MSTGANSKPKASIMTRYEALVEDNPKAIAKIEEESKEDGDILHGENETLTTDEIDGLNDELLKNEDELTSNESANKENEQTDDIYDHVLRLGSISTNMDIYKIDIDKLVDAPPDWNFFPQLPDIKFQELIHSIRENGLLVPLVVWEQGNGKYMILGGHNRKRAYEEIYRLTKDDRYKGIFCTVKGKDDIDDEDAKTIIIDTNFVQRDLSPSIRAKCIMEKYKSIGRKKRLGEGKRAVEVIAEEYDIGRTQVFIYYRLRNLIPEIMRLVDENLISLKAGAILSDLPVEFQQTLFRNYGTYLTTKRIMSISTTKSQNEIIDTLTATDQEYIKVVSTIPKHKYNQFIEHIDKWLKENAL